MNDISVYGLAVIPGRSGCLNCGIINIGLAIQNENDGEKFLKMKKINWGFKSVTFPPVNATAAAMAASDIIKYSGGIGEVISLNKRIGLHNNFI